MNTSLLKKDNAVEKIPQPGRKVKTLFFQYSMHVFRDT
jgi:hypothetical protein